MTPSGKVCPSHLRRWPTRGCSTHGRVLTGSKARPPLLLALDEIRNLAPLTSLPTLMAEGSGTGITAMPVLQSLAQTRDKWSDDQAGAIWDAGIIKVILVRTSNSRDLQGLATLIGERDEFTGSITLGDHGTRSNQRSMRCVPILPDRIRTLPFSTCVTLLRSAPPVVTDLHPWPVRTDTTQLQREEQLRQRLSVLRMLGAPRQTHRLSTASHVHHQRRAPHRGLLLARANHPGPAPGARWDGPSRV